MNTKTRNRNCRDKRTPPHHSSDTRNCKTLQAQLDAQNQPDTRRNASTLHRSHSRRTHREELSRNLHLTIEIRLTSRRFTRASSQQRQQRQRNPDETRTGPVYLCAFHRKYCPGLAGNVQSRKQPSRHRTLIRVHSESAPGRGPPPGRTTDPMPGGN